MVYGKLKVSFLIVLSLIFSAYADAQSVIQHFPPISFNELVPSQSSCARAQSYIGPVYDCSVNQGIQFSGVSFPWPVTGATLHIHGANKATVGGACIQVDMYAFPVDSNIHTNGSAIIKSEKISFSAESSASSYIMRVNGFLGFINNASMNGVPITLSLKRIPCSTAGCACGTSTDSSQPFRLYMVRLVYKDE